MKKRFLMGLLVLCASMAMCVGLAGCRGNSEEHTLTRHEAKEATCTEEGNIEYWDCSHCDKLFADAEGKTPVTSVVVPKKAHTIPDDAYHAPVPSDCETDGTLAYWECSVCHGKFANQAGTKELASIVDPAAHVLMAHKQESPTFTEPGKKAYYECEVCGKKFLDENAATEATEANMRIEPLGEENVEVSVTMQDTDGTTLTDTDLELKLILQNAAFEKTYGSETPIAVTDGKLSLNKIGAGEYKAVVTNNNSYFEAPLVIEKGVGTANLALVKTKHIVTQCDTIAAKNDDGEAFVFTTPWADGVTAPSVSLVNPDAITGKNYFVDFTVNTTGWTNYTSRIGIAIAGNAADDSLTGFVLFTSGSVTETFRVKPGFKFDSAGAEDYAALSNGAGQGTNIALNAGELRMRAVRDSGKAYLYTFTNNQWEKLLEYTVSNELDAAVVFGARMSDGTGTATISGISYGEYHEQEITSEKITLAHFVKGEKYYTSAGVETTQSELEVLPLKQAVLTLVTKDNFSLAGKKVTLINSVFGESIEKTVEEGNTVTLQNIYAATYDLQVEGYDLSYDVEIAETCEASVKVEGDAYIYGNKNDLKVEQYLGGWAQDRDVIVTDSTDTSIVVKVTPPTAKEVIVNTGNALNGITDFMMQFKLSAINLREDPAHPQLGIRVAEGTVEYPGSYKQEQAGAAAYADDVVGLCMSLRRTNLNGVGIQQFYNWVKRDNTLYQNQSIWLKQYYNTITDDMLANGIDVRVIRLGGKVTLYFNLDGKWQEAATVTLTHADAEAKIGFYFSGGGKFDNTNPIYATYTFTNFEIKTLDLVHNLTYHEAKDSTCSEVGNIAYWSCSHCDKFFADADGNNALSNVSVPKKPHTIADESHHVAVPHGCETDGTLEYWECSVCHGKFADQAGQNELESIVDPAAHTLTAHEQESPTFTEAGKKAYYECEVCGKKFLDENATTEATEANMRIEPLGEENVEVSVTMQDTDGTTLTDTDLELKLILQNAAFEKTYGSETPIAVTDGKLSLNKIGAGEYKAVVTNNNSYFEARLTIKKDAAQASLVLIKTKHTVTQCDTIVAKNDNGEAFEFTTPWDNGGVGEGNVVKGTPSVSLQDSAITGTKYFVDFLVNTTGWTESQPYRDRDCGKRREKNACRI